MSIATSSRKPRVMVGVWLVTADRLKALSARTGQTQVALADQAIREFEERMQAEESRETMKTLASIGLGILLTATVAQTAPSWDNRLKLQQTVAKVRIVMGMHTHAECIGVMADPTKRVGPVPGARAEANALCATLVEERERVQTALWRQCRQGNFGRIVDPDGLVVCP